MADSCRRRGRSPKARLGTPTGPASGPGDGAGDLDVAATVSGLVPAPAASGPGSRDDEIVHSLAAQRRAIRVMRVQVRRP